MSIYFERDAFETLDELDKIFHGIRAILDNMNGYLNGVLKDCLVQMSGNSEYLLVVIGINDEKNSLRYEYAHDLTDKIRGLMNMLFEKDFRNYEVELFSISRLLDKIRGLLDEG